MLLKAPLTTDAKIARLRGSGCGGSKSAADVVKPVPALGLPAAAKAQIQMTQMSGPQPLSAKELEKAAERYSTTSVLRALLSHDAALGGVPIKLLSARWLLTYFQANAEARLEHRQHLERTAPEAFVTGAKLERVLAELVSGTCMAEVGGEYKAATQGSDTPVEIAFPSAAAMSHMCAPRSPTRRPNTCATKILQPTTPPPPTNALCLAGGSPRTTPIRTPRTFARSGCPRSSGSTRSECGSSPTMAMANRVPRTPAAYQRHAPQRQEAVLEAADFAIFIE